MTPLTPRLALRHSGRTFIWSATALGLVILLVFFAGLGYDFYRGTLQLNEQSAKNVAALVEQSVARNIELYDLSLQAVLEDVHDPKIMALEPSIRQKAIFDRSATAQGLGALVALDRNGSIFLDSLSATPRAGNFADREYFIRQRDSPRDIGLYVSRPFRARLQDNLWSISVSRRINGPDGAFGGIVSGTIKLDYFRQLFRSVALGSRGSLVLLRDDGVMIVRNEENDDRIGADWSTAPVFSHASGRSRGSFVSQQSMDGVPRLYAFSRIGNLPLLVVVGIPLDQAFAPWRSKMFILAGIFAVMAASVVLLVWMLDTELGRRAWAEKTATELARTDGLTDLANRRAFDEGLSNEWARAARGGRPLSLLMIDADHFKLFNDTYGHVAGDRALAAVAGVIRAHVGRVGDLPARYGGEEFAVLLPDASGPDAARIADDIRAAVRELRMNHAASEHKIVTLSVGVGTAAPRPDTSAGTLVRDADAALYRAKNEGRDRTCISNILSPGFDLSRRTAAAVDS
jgi:diguanylate cyclase (GGDEF)-like protein